MSGRGRAGFVTGLSPGSSATNPLVPLVEGASNEELFKWARSMSDTVGNSFNTFAEKGQESDEHNLNAHLNVNASPSTREALVYDRDNSSWKAEVRVTTFIQATMPTNDESSLGDLWLEAT
tara:strand:+ start:1827 stop:2189 length:363 start_codon:yes stop_codon:yes gene_type:complete